jgi:predicted membrane-bound spermidine synthase
MDYIGGSESKDEQRIRTAVNMMLINSVSLMASCIIVFALAAPSLAAGVFEYLSDAPFYSTLIKYFPTVELLTTFMQQVAFIGIVAGVIGFAAWVLARKRRHWLPTMIPCFLSALGGIITGVGLILGAIAFRRLYKARSAFAG